MEVKRRMFEGTTILSSVPCSASDEFWSDNESASEVLQKLSSVEFAGIEAPRGILVA